MYNSTTTGPQLWELKGSFEPEDSAKTVNRVSYIDINRIPVDSFENVPFKFNKEALGSILHEQIILPDENNFVAGNFHNFADRWRSVIEDENSPVFDWIVNKVDIHDFMIPFKGTFLGVKYNHSYPPSRHFKNAPICEQFVDYINSELTLRLKTGAISYLGRVGEVEPPYIISPITIEPTKPRLCLNLMYLNCFMKDTPFSLDTLQDVPHLIKRNSYMSKMDDKSAYLNMFMTEKSRQLLGFQWGGHYFCSNTLVFGWKNAAFVYHTTNLQVMSFLRKLSITGLLYIDDRLLEEFNGTVPRELEGSYSRACIATRLTIKLLVSLGFYLGIEKCIFNPCQELVFLGMLVNSLECSFFITEKRRQKFISLREEILSARAKVSVTCIQKFAGLCISIAMAIPAAKLYSSCCNRAISEGVVGNGMISIEGELREEMAYWRFLDTWNEPFPWLSEGHNVLTLTLTSDSSDYKWGACYLENGKKTELSDYWVEDQRSLPIMVKEALALRNALLSLGSKLEGKRVHAQVDNKAVVHAWENQYSKSPDLNVVLKEIFQINFRLKCSLSLTFVPSSENIADGASRALKKSDAMLSQRAWLYIQYLFGPHTIDMFSLDSNAMRGEEGDILRHFTPFPSPETSGVDAFAQGYSIDENYYAHPPFCMLSAVVKFIILQEFNCTLIFPDISPVQPWVTLIHRFAIAVIPIGLAHDKGVILYPSKKGYLQDKKGLYCNLLAARFAPSKGTSGSLRYQLHNPIKEFEVRTPVLLIGDSMVRFLRDDNEFLEVISIGGAKFSDLSYPFLLEKVNQANPYLLLLHVGTNDVNKQQVSDIDVDRNTQIEVRQMFKNLTVLQHRFCFAVGISGCICTRSSYINERVFRLNGLLTREAKRSRFHFIDNCNIDRSQLKDFVHLNSQGEASLKRNLKGLL